MLKKTGESGVEQALAQTHQERPARRGRPAATLRNYGIVVAVVIMFIALSIASPVFFSTANFLNLLDQNAPLGIVTCAATLVIVGGGFDLSVGAIYAFAGVMAAEAALKVGVIPGIAFGLLVGIGLGVLNGLLVTVGRINTFIATLATSIMIVGLGQVVTGGFLVTVSNPGFAVLGNGAFLGVKYSIWLFFLMFLVFSFLLSRTTFGRYVYAVGGNAEAARFSGVRVDLVRILTFALSGLAAALAGVISASRISQGEADVGSDLALSAIASVVIGGTSILGGEGDVWRSMLGVFLLAFIGNGFDLLNVNPIYQQIVKGAIIVVAVTVDAWSRLRRG
jgi:ribose transport system permease protein